MQQNTQQAMRGQSDRSDAQPKLRSRLTFLVLSATFPPRGGSSVQRVAKFVKYARRGGHRPIVLTTSFESPGHLEDPSLLDELPVDLEVHRIARDLPSGGDLTARIRRRLLVHTRYPDENSAWGRKVVSVAKSVATFRHLDAVFVSFGSPSALIAGARLSRDLGLPLVLDIRDLWTRNEMRNRRNRQGTILGRFDRWIEARAWKHVNHFTVVSEGYREILWNSYGIPKDRCSVIYNGFDPEDFRAAAMAPHEAKYEGQTVRYAGFVTETEGLRNLLRALARVNNHRRRQHDRPVYFEIMGGTPQRVIDSAVDGGVWPDWLRVHGYHSHYDAIRFMKGADILALFQPSGVGMLTGKFFEYAGSRRPILHLDNRTAELRSLIERHQLGLSVEHDNVDSISEAIERLLGMGEDTLGEPPPSFRRDFQAQQFLRVIESVAAPRQQEQKP